MQHIIVLLYKSLRRFKYFLLSAVNKIWTSIIFYCNNVKVRSFSTNGIPYITVARGGECTIGSNFRMNNNLYSNPIGRTQKCILAVGPKGRLKIGKNIGISFTAINCQQSVTIKDNVLIGGGTCIYDSDFHPLNVEERIADNDNVAMAPVVIEENVFVGANSTILKGVIIGAGSIIGACSVVSKSIPAGEIWAGNPAKFIKAAK